MFLAKAGDAESAYAICKSAIDANVFYHSTEHMFLIHVVWFSECFTRLRSSGCDC